MDKINKFVGAEREEWSRGSFVFFPFSIGKIKRSGKRRRKNSLGHENWTDLEMAKEDKPLYFLLPRSLVLNFSEGA